MATKALKRASGESEQRDVEKALRKAEDGEQSEVNSLAAERWIEALEIMYIERLEAKLRQDAKIHQESELRRMYLGILP